MLQKKELGNSCKSNRLQFWAILLTFARYFSQLFNELVPAMLNEIQLAKFFLFHLTHCSVPWFNDIWVTDVSFYYSVTQWTHLQKNKY